MSRSGYIETKEEEMGFCLNKRCANCGFPLDNTIHNSTWRDDYHVYVEPDLVSVLEKLERLEERLGRLEVRVFDEDQTFS